MMEYLELMAVALGILLFFKPEYLKKFAASLGEATSEFLGEFKRYRSAPKPSDRELVLIAEVLGIDVKGKTVEQLKKEIVDKLMSA